MTTGILTPVVLQRNNFTRSFAMESIRKNLVWRLNNLWLEIRHPPIPIVHCLPTSVRDPLGRPILFIEVVAFNESTDDFKPHIIQGFERLRGHLVELNDISEPNTLRPVLQYVVLLDLKGLSMQSLVSD